MQNHKHTSHRHLVAFPLFMVMVGLSFAQPLLHLPEALDSIRSKLVTGQEERFSMESGIYGVLYSGSFTEEESVITLTEGAALLASKSIISVQVGNTSLTTMNGEMYVSVKNNILTIAAITSPVAVEHGDQRMVVPAGMQWQMNVEEGISVLTDGFALWMEDRTPQLLPKNFIERKLSDLSLVKASRVSLPKAEPSLPQKPDTSLLLPVSADTVLREYQEQVLGTVVYAVEQLQAESIETLLVEDVVQEVVRTKRGTRVLATLLADVPTKHTALRMHLVQQLSMTESLWEVASQHPAYREVAWSVFGPETSVESQLTHVFLLPFSALTSEVFTPFVFERHMAAVVGLLDKVGDSSSFIEHILAAHVPLVMQLDSLGYPQRSLKLKDTLLTVIDSAKLQTSAMQEAAKQLRTFKHIDVSTLPLPKPEAVKASVTTVPEPEQVVELTADQAEAKAYDMLTKAGALFSVKTVIAPYAINTVKVSDILFSSSSEDRSVTFSLNVVTGVVTDIEVNGETNFPYTPTFDGFVRWISK